MPVLRWESKQKPTPQPASLVVDSLVYPQGAGYPDVQPENSLACGDNLEVMSAWLPEWEGRINLIYADPPFFTNRHYPARIGRGEDSRRPQDWRLGEGYADSWVTLDEYLDMLYPRLHMMHRLLSPSGTLYLHLDWHANAYARLLLDEIFGPERLLNEIVWTYHGPSPIRSAFNRKHDTILVYTKSSTYTFNADAVRQPYDANTVKTFEASTKAGFGKVPDLERGKVPEDWWYFPVVARLHNERTGYPTQKPAALLERIIQASSKPGDVVADFFCGSGTTLAVAARLDRRFLGSDIAWRAIHTTQARLVHQGCRAFQILHLLDHPVPQQEVASPYPFQPQGQNLVLDASGILDVNYWEVDPNWDGRVFRSAAQATRPLRQTQVADHVPLPADYSQVRVRLVTAAGDFFQETLQTFGGPRG